MVSFLHNIEIENSYACGDLFHFYISLKQKITMLETWFHFYASLKPKGKLCLKQPISFFNELDIEKELCLGMVSFLCKLETKR